MNHIDNLPMRYIALAISVVIGTAIGRHFFDTPTARARRAGATLPPGPKPEFLIGSLRNFPKKRWYETFEKWKEEFGMYLVG
jgi:hypothetical protein